MNVALDSPVNVQRSPTLIFSPRSTPLTLRSPTISQADTSTLPPPAENTSGLNSSPPISAPQSPIMPDATSTLPAPLFPPSPAAAPELDSMDLLNARTELAQAREQLTQTHARLLLQERNAEPTAPQAQIVSPRLHSTSSSPQDPPSTDVATVRDQPTTDETPRRLVAESNNGAHDIDATQPAEEQSTTEESQQPEASVRPSDAPIEPPLPIDPDETPPSSPASNSTAEPSDWVDIEEDASAPDEEEELFQTSANDVQHYEQSLFGEAPEDPEQQPLQKMRLTWVIHGVRGTREKPNRARVMNSPAALVGGFYWQFKFFPRGNDSTDLSVYVRCSRKEPRPDGEVPENTFSVVYGAPDADLGNLKPAIDISVPATGHPRREASRVGGNELIAGDAAKKSPECEAVQHDESANASAGTEEDCEEDAEDWRVSAQIGVVIYNPEEPRVNKDMAACHQFNKRNDDWGWTNFYGPWSEIHKRKPGQPQPLLRNDTLALDAYIRIFSDPSQALWWHRSNAEPQWDSVSLAGYRAMGTKLSHCPAVAAITSWLLVAPFRKIFQGLDTEGYRRDPNVRPQPLCAQLQMILYLMRKQDVDKEDGDKHVSLAPIIEIMDKLGESGSDVVTFWEGFRRSLELELQTNPCAVDRIADIFDARACSEGSSIPTSPLKIPVGDVFSVQGGIERVFAQASARQYFPKFLTVEFERQRFDTGLREWKLSYDRVQLNEELDLSRWSVERETSNYTLYGFVVHKDERNSGKFYSILRPGGPGSKWLAFDDGATKQVISYTKHRIQQFEGLEGDALKVNKVTWETAYLVMYIRTDLVKDFLPGPLEPYELSPWLKNCPQVLKNLKSKDIQPCEEKTRSEVVLEIYASEIVNKRHGLIDIQDLKDVQGLECKYRPQHLTVPAETTYQELRQKLAKWNNIDNVEKIKLWTIEPPLPGEPLNLAFKRINRLYKHVGVSHFATQSVCIWMRELITDEEVKSFGDPEPLLDFGYFDRTVPEGHNLDSNAQEISGSLAEVEAGEEANMNEVIEVVEPPAANVPPHDGNFPTVFSPGNEELSNNSTATPDEAPVVVQASTEAHGEAQAQSSPASSSVPADEASGQLIVETRPSAMVSIEDESLIAALIAQDLEEADVVVPTMAASTAEIPVDASANSAVVEPIEAPATGIPVSEHPSLESSEAPPPPAIAETSNDDAQSESIGDDDDDEDGTARPVPFYYGFIQLFDAPAQDFLIHGDFFAQATDNVKDFVRTQLGYPADKDFLVWRRGNAYRLRSIKASSTFEEDMHTDDICSHSNCRFDGFVLVIGDVLSASAQSSLAAISSFHSPETLSHYIWFSARKHPVKAHTGHVTISSFGLEYYSGYLLKGLYSGLGTHITATGHSYTGPFMAGSRSTSQEHPEGTCTYPNGDTYTGSWANNEKHGQGVSVEKRTGNKYVGGYKEGKRWGKGITYWEVADEEAEMCPICYGEVANALFYECGHVCACVECAKQVEVCPICRRPIKSVVKIWKA